MSSVARPSALRGEIENVLARKIDGLYVAGTVAWLTTEMGGQVEHEPVITAELQAMEKDGMVTTRRLRSGHTLWKLTDKHFTKWQAHAGLHANLNPARSN